MSVLLGTIATIAAARQLRHKSYVPKDNAYLIGSAILGDVPTPVIVTDVAPRTRIGDFGISVLAGLTVAAIVGFLIRSHR